MKKLLIFLVFIYIILLAGCTSDKEEKTLYGEYLDIKGYTNATYQKDYLMMDCCTEWQRLVRFIQEIDGVNSAEAFEYYLYDEDGNDFKFDAENGLQLTFKPSEKFKERVGETKVCLFPVGKVYPCEVADNGDITFTADTCGIFVCLKFGEGDLWISNEECTGQCKTCSDDW